MDLVVVVREVAHNLGDGVEQVKAHEGEQREPHPRAETSIEHPRGHEPRQRRRVF